MRRHGDINHILYVTRTGTSFHVKERSDRWWWQDTAAEMSSWKCSDCHNIFRMKRSVPSGATEPVMSVCTSCTSSMLLPVFYIMSLSEFSLFSHTQNLLDYNTQFFTTKSVAIVCNLLCVVTVRDEPQKIMSEWENTHRYEADSDVVAKTVLLTCNPALLQHLSVTSYCHFPRCILL